MPTFAAVVVTAALSAAPTGAVNPGVMIGLSNAGLDYARQVVIPIILSDIKGLKLPDINGDVDTPVGHVSYSISDLVIGGASIGQSSLAFTKTGMALGLGQGAITASAHWHYREDHWPHVSDSGTVDISTSGFGVSTTIDPVADPKTRAFQLVMNGCTFDAGSVDVHFHGGASWLYNIFKGLIEDAVKKALGGQVCPLLGKEVATANAALERVPMNVSIDHGIVASYGLTANPIVTSEFLVTPHSGVFTPPHVTAPSPFAASAVPVPGSLPRMVYLWVTAFEPEIAAWAYQQAGVLDVLINASDIPPSSPVQLNTSTFADIIPQLSEKYPNMAMSIGLVARSPVPVVVDVTPASLNVSLYFDLHFNVIEPSGTSVPVFVLNSTTRAHGDVTCNDTHAGAATLFFHLSFLDLDVALESSNIGPFSPLALQALVQIVIQGVALPQINKAGAKGVPIPIVDGIQIVNPQIVLADGYIRVDTDIHYNS